MLVKFVKRYADKARKRISKIDKNTRAWVWRQPQGEHPVPAEPDSEVCAADAMARVDALAYFQVTVRSS
jgi:hypothetical protein